jgi:hypothetical protein
MQTQRRYKEKILNISNIRHPYVITYDANIYDFITGKILIGGIDDPDALLNNDLVYHSGAIYDLETGNFYKNKGHILGMAKSTFGIFMCEVDDTNHRKQIFDIDRHDMKYSDKWGILHQASDKSVIYIGNNIIRDKIINIFPDEEYPVIEDYYNGNFVCIKLRNVYYIKNIYSCATRKIKINTNIDEIKFINDNLIWVVFYDYNKYLVNIIDIRTKKEKQIVNVHSDCGLTQTTFDDGYANMFANNSKTAYLYKIDLGFRP